jgi:hypothetical protein
MRVDLIGQAFFSPNHARSTASKEKRFASSSHILKSALVRGF